MIVILIPVFFCVRIDKHGGCQVVAGNGWGFDINQQSTIINYASQSFRVTLIDNRPNLSQYRLAPRSVSSCGESRTIAIVFTNQSNAQKAILRISSPSVQTVVCTDIDFLAFRLIRAFINQNPMVVIKITTASVIRHAQICTPVPLSSLIFIPNIPVTNERGT